MTSEPSEPSAHTLELRFHGRVLDHLGIQMYHSPVAAIAELISNAWDADATVVLVSLPASKASTSTFVIEDDGIGMTLEECQSRFLNVGYNRRGKQADGRTPGGRPPMGRKGIGKFAGFGVAQIVEVTTTSKVTGETTRFSLDIRDLRGDTEEYLGSGKRVIQVLEYLPPDPDNVGNHGTSITLRGLSIGKKPNELDFARSMARRFLLLQNASNFEITIGSTEVSSLETEVEKVEFTFPGHYAPDERPNGLMVDQDTGWGTETLTGGRTVRWKVKFYESPIHAEDLAGVAIYAHGKLAQSPFNFNLTGGFGGQTGLAYMSGQVQADFIDELPTDLIATERQRIDWQHPEVETLLEWGQMRVKTLLRSWQKARSDEKVTALEARLAPFSSRIAQLPTHERAVIKKALRSIAKIETIDEVQFADLALAILTAWEGGRLQELINQIGQSEDFSAEDLVGLLLEAKVLVALHTAEAVRAKLLAVASLRERVKSAEFENSLRDYVAQNPWLISPRWETFLAEKSVAHLIDEAAAESGLAADPAYAGRVDLALSGGETLLVIEFMRPGVTVDWDHVNRFERYVLDLTTRVEATMASKFIRVKGLLVADKVEKKATIQKKLAALREAGMDATDWDSLLAEAESQWRDYMYLVADRAPDDDRVERLRDDSSAPAQD